VSGVAAVAGGREFRRRHRKRSAVDAREKKTFSKRVQGKIERGEGGKQKVFLVAEFSSLGQMNLGSPQYWEKGEFENLRKKSLDHRVGRPLVHFPGVVPPGQLGSEGRGGIRRGPGKKGVSDPNGTPRK